MLTELLLCILFVTIFFDKLLELVFVLSKYKEKLVIGQKMNLEKKIVY